MSKVAVVTDSGAALPAKTLARLHNQGGFALVPMPVTISGRQPEADRVDEEIVLAHALGEQVHTSSPSVSAFVEVYQQLFASGFDAVISIHLSSQLSATYNASFTAARQVEGKVFVVDSATVAMAYGYAAQTVHALAQSGTHSAESLAEIAREICENSELYFMIPTLDALRRGGRVHPALARVGQLLQIRPVGTVQAGKLTYLDRPRTLESALEALVYRVEDERGRRRQARPLLENDASPAPSGRIVAVHYCGKVDDAQDILARLEASSGPDTDDAVEVSSLPAVLSAHTGVGAVGVVVY